MKDAKGNEILHEDDSIIIKWWEFSDHSRGVQCFSNSGNTKGMKIDISLLEAVSLDVYDALVNLHEVLLEEKREVGCTCETS